jgi:hypothetical protein
MPMKQLARFVESRGCGGQGGGAGEDRHTARPHALKHKHPHLLNHLR